MIPAFAALSPGYDSEVARIERSESRDQPRGIGGVRADRKLPVFAALGPGYDSDLR